MNWIDALQNLYRLFPAAAGPSFHWGILEKSIQKTLGLQRVVFALREGENLVLENGKEAFAPAERAGLLKRLNGDSRSWIIPAKRKGSWLGFWPVRGSDGACVACLGLGQKKNGGSLSPGEKKFLDLAVDRVAVFWETRELWKCLERADRQSAVGFMSMALSHEIRNPLTAMATLVQLLSRKKDDANFMEDFQRVMNREITHLTHLTETFLDFSKSAGESRGRINLQEVVKQVTGLLKPLFNLKKTRLVVTNPGNLFLAGNEHQMESLIMNLLQNAYQSAGPGGIVHLSTRLLPGKPGGKWVELKVGDNGPGIPPESLKKIFDPHFSTKSGGAGLGLAICRKIVGNHLGHLTVKSSPRKGTEFRVLLPVPIKT